MLDKRIMCLDLGLARIGVAQSDLLGITAQGVTVIQVKDFETNLAEIKKLVKENNVGKIIVGYPLNLDGSEGNKARAIREQFEKLKENLDCEMELWDERFSTKQAERILEEGNVHWKKKKQVIDKMAAQVILQGYLQSHSL